MINIRIKDIVGLFEFKRLRVGMTIFRKVNASHIIEYKVVGFTPNIKYNCKLEIVSRTINGIRIIEDEGIVNYPYQYVINDFKRYEENS